MPNIKISELSAPIAVTDSDLIPGVQSGVTRRMTWGGLKSTLAGALGRSYLGLGTAAVANVTTSATDTTAGRVLKVGDFGLGAAVTPFPLSTDLDLVKTGGTYRLDATCTNGPVTSTVGDILCVVPWDINTFYQWYYDASPAEVYWRKIGQPWAKLFTSSGTNTLTVDTASFGYGTGSGGTVTQATSKATAVTLNKPSGQITTAAGALAASTAASFTLTNNKIAANDIPMVVIKSGATAGAYVVQVDAVAAGSCRISIRNMTAGSLSETLVLQFNIEKGAIA